MSDPDSFAFEPEPRRRASGLRSRLGVWLGIVALVGAATIAVGYPGSGGGGGLDDSDPEGETTFVDPAGPYDGLESIGLPVTVVPDIGVVDGQAVTVTASGFTPNISVAIVQCWSLGAGSGSEANCDAGNYALGFVDEQGTTSTVFEMRRYITTSIGEFDCAEGGIPEGCVIAVANISDYDESGTAPTFFDPEVEGRRAALVQVEPVSGLRDGDLLTVTGSNFVPGEVTRVTQCVFNTSGIPGCFGSNPTGEIEIDAAGGFTATMIARRLVSGVGGTVDCVDDPYGCRVVVAGEKIANPVEITFDASTRPPTDPSFTVSPSSGLVDGQSVHLEITEIRSAPGDYVIEQCVDVLAPDVACVELSTGTILDGTVSADVAVVATLPTADGTTRDCADPRRQCYLRVVVGDVGVVDRLPVAFEESAS